MESGKLHLMREIGFLRKNEIGNEREKEKK